MSQTQTPQKGAFALWLAETMSRFGTPSPTYFKIVGWIGVIVAGLGLLPNFLVEAGLSVPDWALGTYTVILQGAGIAAKIIAMLPTDRTILSSKIEDKKLPFTTQKELNNN